MAHLIDKDAVVAEIERLYEKNSSKEYCYTAVLEDLEDFLDTPEVKEVQEESVSEELEEAAMQYAKLKHKDAALQKIVSWDFKAGAKWQKERMLIKACEFIRTPNIYVVDINRYGGATTNYDATVDKFKKYMED